MPESPIRHSGWPLWNPFALGKGVHHGGVDIWVGVEVECRQGLLPWELGRPDPPLGPAAGAVVALGEEQFGEEPAVGHLLTPGPVGVLGEGAADGGHPQQPAGLVDRGVSGFLGHSTALGGHGAAP